MLLKKLTSTYLMNGTTIQISQQCNLMEYIRVNVSLFYDILTCIQLNKNMISCKEKYKFMRKVTIIEKY